MQFKITPDGDKSVLDLLTEQGVSIAADCAGDGRCGKCRIRVLAGELPVTAADMRFFSASKQLEGYRLACCAYPSEELLIEADVQEGAKILSNQVRKDVADDPELHKTMIDIVSGAKKESGPVFATTDIGTTTIVVSLYDSNGERIGTASVMNPQRSFGSDVVSRIQAARAGKLEELRGLAVTAVRRCILDILDRLDMNSRRLKLIVVCGNTAMLHIFRGLDCEGLAAYPFEPVSIGYAEEPAELVFKGMFESATVVFFPGISAFVGADVVSGIFGQHLDEKKEPTLFMDMGTNGEIVLKIKDSFTCASASAGPAFEGGELSCGMASMTGAAESVRIIIDEDGVPGVLCRVIGGGPVKGLCGSGALELLAGLIDNGMIDQTGAFVEEYMYDGFPFAEKADGTVLAMTQLDVRSLQLAKSAIRAASEILLSHAGIEKPDIILAGGMGTFLEPDLLKSIDILPEARSISFAGNTALKGMERYIRMAINGDESKAAEILTRIANNTKEVTISNDPEFQPLFFKYMEFKPEKK